MRNKIYISAPADRSFIVSALTRNGYSVRDGREKEGSKYRWFVEYWQ